MHPLHRSSFATKSLFETAPSQRWRRHLDVQDEHLGWQRSVFFNSSYFVSIFFVFLHVCVCFVLVWWFVFVFLGGAVVCIKVGVF